MKKYLFGKIHIDSAGIHFMPFRKANIAESFLACCNCTFDQEEWDFAPYSFKDFLRMLSKTKLNECGEYEIDASLPLTIERNRFEPYSFDELLQTFARQVYATKPADKDALSDFYKKAYTIQEEAKKEKELLDKKPEDFIME